MSYTVIHYFTDLQDFNHPYKVGDTFPRLGVTVSDARLRELSTSMNKQKKPLIKLVEEKAETKVVEAVAEAIAEVVEGNVGETLTKTFVNRMPTAELKKLATKNGIVDAEKKSGSQLKKILIEKLNL